MNFLKIGNGVATLDIEKRSHKFIIRYNILSFALWKG